MLSQVITFNRTAYGIEIEFEGSDCPLCYILLIAPLMELKYSTNVGCCVCKGLLIAPLMELKC